MRRRESRTILSKVKTIQPKIKYLLSLVLVISIMASMSTSLASAEEILVSDILKGRVTNSEENDENIVNLDLKPTMQLDFEKVIELAVTCLLYTSDAADE